jgi:RNA polymerase sigma factor (sigma-70 family)
LNDSRLSAYLEAADELTRGPELGRILTEEVQPRVAQVLAKYVRFDWPVEPHDVEDILGQVTLRVLRKLRAATIFEEESIQNLEAYVTTVTRNMVRDLMRQRAPERTRIKRRLRYLFTHEPRLALWLRDGVAHCGLAAWSGRQDFEPAVEVIGRALASPRPFWDTPADSAVDAMTRLRTPARLADLVSALVFDTGAESTDQRPNPIESVAPQRDHLEARQYLQVLWTEILELPARQRAALLLNLREPGSGNAVILFVSTGIATLEEIASAVEMSPAELSALWDDLPLDDQRIAAHLGLQRQQVINLRKSARERLTRRMSNHFNALPRRRENGRL